MQASDAVMTEVTRVRDTETSLQTLITSEITHAKTNESLLTTSYLSLLTSLATIQGRTLFLFSHLCQCESRLFSYFFLPCVV
jgi:hypothetical protein